MRLPKNCYSINNQIQVFSVNTSAFYSQREKELADQMLPLYLKRNELKSNMSRLIEKQNKKNVNDSDFFIYKEQLNTLKNEMKLLKEEIEKMRKKLSPALKDHETIRELREDALTYAIKDEQGNPTGERARKNKSVIRIFESELTRILKMKSNLFSDAIIVVEEVYSDITKQLIQEGFIYNNIKYVYYSSSAGQIRTKKLVFLQQSLWDRHQDTLMCGLSLSHINHLGGSNVNKFLAYLSLQTSASSRFHDFDIDKVIVCDDLEIDVLGKVDYINNQNFEIERKSMKIPMTPTDGAGMCLPSVSNLSFQFRSSWMKGLVSPFDFRSWIIEMREQHPDQKIGYVTDIWGEKEYDVIEENIEMILCKSMFKMHEFYDSWDDFKQKFKKNNCHAAICKVENEVFGEKIKLNYQMIQNLPDTSDEELTKIVSSTVSNIESLGSNRAAMLKLLGVRAENKKKNYYQQALELYPELLGDEYGKEVVKAAKRSLVRNAKAGKVEVAGKYLFAVPDWWAYCEWLMMRKDKYEIKGLLKEDEVYSKFFVHNEKLDILRSPSLYREHGIRTNIVDDLKRKWFVSNGIYIGHSSLLAKLLMLDYDGDQLFCVNEPTLVQTAERQMEEIVPLHYDVSKAMPSPINRQTIYNGLKAAFSCNIGEISNQMSKVWNSNAPDLEVLKWLCLMNNEVIDFAKTLHKSTVPKHVAQRIKKATKGKLPYLFVYAKDKKKEHVETDLTGSVMNRLAKLIPNKRIAFNHIVGHFDYRMLMRNANITIDDNVIRTYSTLDLKKWTMGMQSNDRDSSGDNINEYAQIRKSLLAINDNIYDLVDMLVSFLYLNKNSPYKTTLWSSFGDIIVENIKMNIARNEGKLLRCVDCNLEFIKERQRQMKCNECQKRISKEREKVKKQKQRKKCPL